MPGRAVFPIWERIHPTAPPEIGVSGPQGPLCVSSGLVALIVPPVRVPWGDAGPGGFSDLGEDPPNGPSGDWRLRTTGAVVRIFWSCCFDRAARSGPLGGCRAGRFFRSGRGSTQRPLRRLASPDHRGRCAYLLVLLL